MSQSFAHLRAIGFALMGFSFWVVGDTCMKLAGEMSVPKYEVMSIAGFGGLVFPFLSTIAQGNIDALRPRRKKALAIMAALIVGFIGVVIAINPSHFDTIANNRISYIALVIGLLGTATQQLTMRILGEQETRENMAFYPRFGAIFGGFIAMMIWGYEPISTKGLLCSLATGVVGGIGWVSMAHAYKLAPAATVAPFHYSQILTAALLSYLIWHELPSLHLIVGMIIIIGSGLYIVRHTHNAHLLAQALKDNP